ncbi:unnamed protein product, partial [marine sediment metagenome]
LVIKAFDRRGKEKWKADNGPAWRGADDDPAWGSRYPDSRSAPTVTNGRLYVLSGAGRLGCFDAATGRKIWLVPVRENFKGSAPVCGYAESVLVDGERVVCSPGGRQAALVALDTKTGRLAWRTRKFEDDASYGSAILCEHAGRRQIVTMTAKHAIGVDPVNGRLLWRYRHDGMRGAGNMSACTMVFRDGGLYGSIGHGIGGFKLQLRGPDSAGRFEAVQVWADGALDNLHGGLVLVDGHIYGSKFFTSSRGSWVCLDFQTGKA